MISLINHDSSQGAVRSWSNLPRSYGYEMSTLSTHGAFQSYWSYCADDVFSLIQGSRDRFLVATETPSSCAKANFIPSPSIPNITRNGWKSLVFTIPKFYTPILYHPQINNWGLSLRFPCFTTFIFRNIWRFHEVRDLKPSQTIASNKLT